MSTSVDSHRGAGPSDEDGEPDDATAPLRRPAAEDLSTDRFPAPSSGRGSGSDGGGPQAGTTGGWFDDATPVPAATTSTSTAASAADRPGSADDSEPAPASVPEPADDGRAPEDPASGPAEDTAGESAAVRPRRRSRGLRVPSAPTTPPSTLPTTPPSIPPPTTSTADAGAPPTATVSPAATTGRPRPTPGPRPTPAPRPPSGPPPSSGPELPVGGPPAPSTPKEPPKKHTAALGRLALVLVLVAAVVGTVVVLQSGSRFGRTDAGPEEIPALEVAPAQVDLNTVGQPNAIAPPSALLPGTAATAQPGRAPSISSWASGLAPRTNIPPIALQAYGMADLAMRKLDPGCHLSWVTLAGLGRIESNHGRYRGASIAPNGAVTPPIIGVPLDGTSGNRAIAGSDGNYDRAEGPMQFIESTWARWGSDGNGDGVADPNNIYDAAFTAGRYLCAGNRDLATGEGWRDAVLSYNFSDDYGRRVYAAAQAYANSTSP